MVVEQERGEKSSGEREGGGEQFRHPCTLPPSIQHHRHTHHHHHQIVVWESTLLRTFPKSLIYKLLTLYGTFPLK